MAGNLLGMAKEPKKTGKKKPFPSRLAVKYVQIPREYWDIFDGMTEDGEKYEGRSVAFLVKLACRAMLKTEGKVDDKGKPLDNPPSE